jgi:hypothetical protein
MSATSIRASAAKGRRLAGLLMAGAVGACFLSQASAQTDIQCLEPNQLRVWRTENLPTGLGVRSIRYAHEGAEATTISTRLFAYHRGSEIVPAPVLRNNKSFVYSPKTPLIRKGYPGSGIAFFLSAYSVDPHGKRVDARCVKYTQESTFEDVDFFSDRAASTASTRIRFEFSNHP